MNLQQFRGKSKLLAGAMIVLLGLAGWGVARASQKFFTPGIHISMKMADPAEAPSKTGFAPVIKTVLPDVVNISTSKVVKADRPDMQGEMPEEMPPFFQQFFGQQFGHNGQQFGPNSDDRSPRHRTEREDSLGSGVIISPDGYILTNNHVVDGATDVRVTLSDKREFKAKVIGTDPKTDIAVLKIDGSRLPGDHHRRFRQSAGRRLCSGHRQSIRRRTDRDHGNRQRHESRQPRHRGLRRFHSDRCADQSRQFRRRAGQRSRRADRHQHRHSGRTAPAAIRASGLPFRSISRAA